MQYYLDAFGFLVWSPYNPRPIKEMFKIEIIQIRSLDGSVLELRDFIVNMTSKVRISNETIEDIVKGKYNSANPIQIRK